MRKAGILLGAGLIAFVLIELLLRWMQAPALDYYRKVKLFHVYHPEYFVGLPENTDLYIKHHDGLWEGRFTTNSLGMRGSPEPIPRAPKILCLGDSLVMGFGVSDDETFCNLLQQYSRQGAFGKDFQFMNIAVDAFGSMGSALRIEDMAPRMDNVRAVLFVISPNDFEMPEALRAQGLEPDDIVDERRMNDPDYALSFKIQFELTRYSYALHAAKLALENLLVKRGITAQSIRQELMDAGLKRVPDRTEAAGPDKSEARKQPVPDWSKTLNYTLSSFRGPVRDRCEYMKPAPERRIVCPEPIPPSVECVDRPPAATELKPLPDFTQKAYDRMMAYTEKNNIQLIPVVLPVQVEELYCHNQGKYHPLGDYALRATQYFEKRGVPVMQLLPAAPKMCSADHVISDHFIPADGHLTRLGNEWVANAIRERLPDLLHKGAN